MGIRQSLPHSPYHDIKNVQESVKQNHRTKVADEAKEIYDGSQDNLRAQFKGGHTNKAVDNAISIRSFDQGKVVFKRLQKKYGTSKSQNKSKDKGRGR